MAVRTRQSSWPGPGPAKRIKQKNKVKVMVKGTRRTESTIQTLVYTHQGSHGKDLEDLKARSDDLEHQVTYKAASIATRCRHLGLEWEVLTLQRAKAWIVLS